MGSTTAGLPFPEPPDTPDVPRDIRALAEAVDALTAARTKANTGALAVWTLSTTDSALVDVLAAPVAGRLVVVDLVSLRFDPAATPAPVYPLSATFTLKQGSTVIARTSVNMFTASAMVPSIRLAGVMAGGDPVKLWGQSGGGNLTTSTNGGLARFVAAVV